ncbi:MAG: radical SAM protein [Ruthenibacterium sp.]
MNLPTIPAKMIVNKTKNAAWFGTDYTMNLYKGCCHGCIYCDSRSTCYGVHDFDTVRVKDDCLAIVRDDLRSKTHTGVVATGAMSDPYNPFEQEMQYTRHALELLCTYGFGVAIDTKSPLITRDIDVLQEIQKMSPVLCKLTITTADDALAAKIEPHVAPSSARFSAMEALAKNGLYAGVLLMPVLPFLEDTPQNIHEIVAKTAAAGARFIYPMFGMTLRGNQHDYYLQKLEEIFPGEYLAQQYTKQFGNRYECHSPQAKRLWEQFRTECDACGLLYKMQDIISGYQQGYGTNQLSFL